MMSHDEIIAVVQAHKEGRKIECCSPGYTNWTELVEPSWNFYMMNYRVKPEPPKPREFWITVYDGQPRSTWKHPVDKYSADEVIHVREVLE